jgi:hypothetical protein
LILASGKVASVLSSSRSRSAEREFAVNGEYGQQSKPKIFDAAPIVWQIVERIQTVETIDHQVSYTCEGRKTNIHREAAATAFFKT